MSSIVEDLYMPKIYKIKEEELLNFCKKALMKYGMSEEHATITSSHLVQTDKWGIYSHGTKNLFNYINKKNVGGVSFTNVPSIELELPSLMVIDAKQTLGFVSSDMAMKKACELAKKTGIAIVFVKNCCHFGAAGCYVNIAAKQGMIGGAFSNVDKQMTIPGAKGLIMGHNPMAFAAPAISQPTIFFDASSSNVAVLKVMRARAHNEKIPDNWIVDKNGIPTTDPSHYPEEGALIPMGNHKGYCIAMFIEIITSVITGGETSMSGNIPSWCFNLTAPNNVSQTFVAINAEAVSGKGVLEKRIEDMITILHNSPKAEGNNRIYVPGEIEWEKSKKSEENGYIEIPDDVYAKLHQLEEMSGYTLIVEE